jgi:hypothetical protein
MGNSGRTFDGKPMHDRCISDYFARRNAAADILKFITEEMERAKEDGIALEALEKVESFIKEKYKV